jgi:hypothetical protein
MLLCDFLWVKKFHAKDIHKEMLPVYSGKYLSRKAVHIGVRNCLKGFRKSRRIFFWDKIFCSPLNIPRFSKSCAVFVACFMLLSCFGLLLNPEDGVYMFRRNVCWLSTEYTAFSPRCLNLRTLLLFSRLFCGNNRTVTCKNAESENLEACQMSYTYSISWKLYEHFLVEHIFKKERLVTE